MKNKSFAWLIFIVLMGFVSACKKSDMAVAGDTKSVAIYKCTDSSAESYICFDSLLTDSRCPDGAECAWQGTALIEVSFHEGGNTHNFIMSLKGFPPLGHTSDTTINGYNIIFTDLKPYPALNTPDNGKEKIKAFFSISH